MFFGFFLVDEGWVDKWAIIGLPAKRHLNGVLLACHDDCTTLNAGSVAS